MTIAATESTISYAGDDTSTVFDIPFVFDTSADLKVIETDADGNAVVKTTGFVIAGGAGAVGTLTRTTALPVGTTLTILDNPDLTQPTDYTQNDAFPAETHEAALDRVTRICKRLSTRLLAAVRFDDGDPSSGDGAILGSVENRKGKYLFFNSTTGAIEYAVNLVTTALSQSIIGQLLFPQTDAEIAAGVTPTNYQYPHEDSGNIFTRYNGSMAQAAATNTTALQNALDSQQTVEIRGNGTHNFNDTIKPNDNNIIEGRGLGTVLKWNVTNKSLIEGKTKATARQYRWGLRNLVIDNTDRANAGAIGIDLSNLTDGLLFNVIAQNVETGFYGVSADGALQNKLIACLASTVDTALILGTLSNEWKFYDFRVADCTDGLIIDDNTGHKFNDLQIENFTATAIKIGATATSQYNKINGLRLENAAAGSSVGFNLHATRAQSTTILGSFQYVNVATLFSAIGTDTIVLNGDLNSPELRANALALGDGSAIDNTTHGYVKSAGSASQLAARNAADDGFADWFAGFLRAYGAAQGAANSVSFGFNSQSTVGAPGGASALPATPTGYLRFFYGATEYVIPYYAQA